MPDFDRDRLQSLQFAVIGGIASGLGAIAFDALAQAIAPLPAIVPLSPDSLASGLFPAVLADPAVLTDQVEPFVEQLGSRLPWSSAALWWGLTVLGRGAIAGVWGGLFGITYRYAVRGERDRQLQVGVVLAFGITAALARWEGVGEFTGDGVAIGWAGVTALGSFAIAALALQVLAPVLSPGFAPKLGQNCSQSPVPQNQVPQSPVPQNQVPKNQVPKNQIYKNQENTTTSSQD